ncbi:xeroderma pigmentosum group C-complementing protein [Pelomyxa schiedti]|nr:xeroderma pigmentosum group C-complementing protein [Pelomyxa schiedti]
MIPVGAVHLPGVSHTLAKKLGIDAAPAMVEWEYGMAGSRPRIDGCVVAVEYAEILSSAMDETESRKAQEVVDQKQNRGVLHWRILTRKLILRQRIQQDREQGFTGVWNSKTNTTGNNAPNNITAGCGQCVADFTPHHLCRGCHNNPWQLPSLAHVSFARAGCGLSGTHVAVTNRVHRVRDYGVTIRATASYNTGYYHDYHDDRDREGYGEGPSCRAGARGAPPVRGQGPAAVDYGMPPAGSEAAVVVADGQFQQNVVMTFGVSSALLTLTHDLRWWVERPGDLLMGANRDYLVVKRASLVQLQDRATGQRIPLLHCAAGSTQAANWKWLVVLNKYQHEVVVVEIPKKSSTTATIIKEPTTFKIDTTWVCFDPEVVGTNGDLLLIRWGNYALSVFGILLVDLVQTCASTKLAVLSSVAQRWTDLPPGFSLIGMSGFTCHAFTNERGSHSFIWKPPRCGYYESSGDVITIDGLTGKWQPTLPGRPLVSLLVSHSQSRFCTFCSGKAYEEWDVNDTTKSVRTQKCMSVCVDAFFEGGLLFQIGKSRQEIHVSEESSGATIVTFNLFRPLLQVTHHFCFPLSE